VKLVRGYVVEKERYCLRKVKLYSPMMDWRLKRL
jgi:hypothetical protein